VMLVWFIAIGGLGALNVVGRPSVLLAASPTYALALVAEIRCVPSSPLAPSY